jgi:beta-phosphoglucomutase-like phosphatase (HAD superfamily)
MTRVLEDYLDDEDRRAIEAVFAAREFRFDKLAHIAGLDPEQDFQHADLRGLNFCGADLRGFNFTGSDLRDVARDRSTVIDSSTVLKDAKVRWVEEADIPIIERMHRVQGASTTAQRLDALRDLEKHHGRSEHVLAFVVNAASETSSLEAFVDYLEFLPPDLPRASVARLVEAGERAVSRKVTQARSRTRRTATAIFALSAVIERLRDAEPSLASAWFRALAAVVERGSRQRQLIESVHEVDASDLKQALRDLV